MCFSAESDFAAAAILTPLAIASLRAAPAPRYLPIAALPAIFAVHQFIEGFVWLGFEGSVSTGVSTFATHLYLAIAQILLPLLVPAAVLLIEPQRRRRWVMAGCLAIGTLTAARFGWIIFAHDVGARESEHVVLYFTDIHIGVWATLGYILATCVPVVLSSKPYLRAFGIANVVGLSLAALVRYESVTSVWCLYAGFASVLVLVFLRQERRKAAHEPTPTASAQPAIT